MKIILCVRAGPNDTGKITKNNPYKAAGLWATLEVASPECTGGADILDLCAKLPAAGVLAAQYPLSLATVFWDLQLHSGRMALASLTSPTLLKDLSYGAVNNAVKLYLLPQLDIDLGNIKTAFTLQQQQQQQLLQQPAQGLVQPSAQILMVKQNSTLLDCISQMPAGRILLVNMTVTQAGIDIGKHRARYVSMAAAVGLAGWLDGIVGAVTTRESNYDGLAACLGAGKKVYVMA